MLSLRIATPNDQTSPSIRSPFGFMLLRRALVQFVATVLPSCNCAPQIFTCFPIRPKFCAHAWIQPQHPFFKPFPAESLSFPPPFLVSSLPVPAGISCSTFQCAAADAASLLPPPHRHIRRSRRYSPPVPPRGGSMADRRGRRLCPLQGGLNATKRMGRIDLGRGTEGEDTARREAASMIPRGWH